jgi:hypothetical protein
MKNGRRPPDWLAAAEGDEATEQTVDIERACSSLLAVTPAYENPDIRCPLKLRHVAAVWLSPFACAFPQADGQLAFSMCDRD